MNITGSLVNTYYICKRKLWLMAHEISPFQDYDLLEMGQLISEETYKREKKEISIGNSKIDVIKKEDGNIIIAEIKKSCKGIKASKMQLLFYLYELKHKGISARGELLIPKEKKRVPVELSEKDKKELEKAIEDIRVIIRNSTPPRLHRSKFCNRCAYREFCFA